MLSRKILTAGHFVAVLLLGAALCSAGPPLRVYTVNYPLAYFAERIGGDHVEVIFPAPPDIDPAFWTPDDTTIGGYQNADLIILNGAGYAKWTEKVSLPMLRTIDSSRSFSNELISVKTEVTHSHGPEGDHSHGGTAFTTWLDLSMAARQAEAIFKALLRKLPDRKTELGSNYEALETELLRLDEKLQHLTDANGAIPLLASHPIYQYMARRYDLNLKMLVWEPDEDPGEQQYQYLQTLVEDHNSGWMVWEGPPRKESIDRLEKMGIKSLVFSPCFNRPEDGNFLTVMEQNIDNLTVVFSQAH